MVTDLNITGLFMHAMFCIIALILAIPQVVFFPRLTVEFNIVSLKKCGQQSLLPLSHRTHLTASL